MAHPTKHKSSSTEDLIDLFKTECQIVKILNQTSEALENNSHLKNVVKNYLKLHDYDM